MQKVQCPSPATLRSLLLGDLTRSERESLEEHLLSCDRCVSEAETIVADDDLTAVTLAGTPLLPEDADVVAALIEKIKQARTQAETVRFSETLPGNPVVDTGASSTKLEPHNLSFLGPAQSPDEIGRLADYRVLEVVGSGGMGLVLRAEDIKLRRQVALKTMKPSIAESPSAKLRFTREAQATAALEHDHIVPIYQVGEDRGVPFIAMQFLKGESLRSRLDRKTRLSDAEVVRLGKEVASGLALAHDHGLIHRDIKPDNIWLEEKTDRAKILDFGLVSASVEDEGLTHSGTVLGTPRYMSPEQALAHPIDHRCDLFSLGSVLYHAAAGQAPFSGNNFTSTLIAVAHQPPMPLQKAAPELNPDVAAAIMRLLEKDPGNRPQSAAEVSQQFADLEKRLQRIHLEQSTGDESSEVRPDARSVLSPALPPSKPPRKGLLLAGAGGLAALILGILVITIRDKDGDETVIRVPSGIEVDVDAPPDSEVTISEEGAGSSALTNSSSEPPMVAEAIKQDESKTEISPPKVDYAAERLAAQEIAEKMTGGNMVLVDADGKEHRIEPSQRTLPEQDFCIREITQIPEMNDELLSRLASCRNLRVFNLYGNAMVTTAGIRSLTNASRLRHLTLGTCILVDSKVLELLANWPELEYAEFAWNNFQVDSLSLPPGCSALRFLGLKSAQVSHSALDVLVNACPELREIDISVLVPGKPSSLQPLAKLNNLERIYCTSLNLDDAAIRTLSQIPKLTKLDLYSPVSDPAGSIQKLSALKDKLTHLEVRVWLDYDIGPNNEDYAALAQLERLESLYIHGLSGSPSNEQLLQLAKLPRLKLLHVGFQDAPRRYDMSGIAACQQSRPELEILVDGYTYRGTPWPEWSREKQAAAQGTAPPSEPTFDPVIERKIAERLIRLNKGHVLLGDSNRAPVPQWELTASSIPTEPFCILEADFGDCELTDDELPALRGCQTLIKLVLDGNTKVSAAAFDRLGPLPTLQHLSAAATTIDDAIMPWLAGSPALGVLNLSQTKLSSDAMASLPGLPLLKELTLPDVISAKAVQQLIQQAPQLTDLDAIVDNQNTLDALNAQPILATLHVAGSVLTDQAVTSIKSNNRLESLVIHDPTPASISLTAQLDQLVSLALAFDAEAKVANQDLSPITSMKRLIRFSLSGQVQPDQNLLEQLSMMRGLRSLMLPPIEQYAVQALRQQRPDMELVVDDRRFPALDDWPGKFEGGSTIAAWDLPADAPQPAIYPFAPEEASKLQQAWAKYLGVPVESENSMGMKFRLIPPGELVVDTPQSDWSPARTALERVDTAFEIGTTEVTVAQFEAFVKATGYKTEAERTGMGHSFKDGGWATRPDASWRNPGYEVKPNLPVTVVSPSDAKAFCDWLSEQESMTYRLPTTQEWYLAGRGGGTNRLGWCTEADALEFDWFQENLPVGVSASQEVNAKKANPFRLHGIIGNAFEFSAGMDSTTYRVGNSWAHPTSDIAYGFTQNPTVGAASDMGFRVVRDQSQKPTSQHPVVLVPRGAPLSSTAMVQRPAPIPGVRSWSVEFAGQRLLNNGFITSWSSTSDLIATSNQSDSIVCLWDSEGKFKSALMGLEGRVTDMAFSSDGKRVAATCISIGHTKNNQLRVWDVASGKCEASVANPFWIWDLAWAPDGNWIAFGDDYGCKLLDTRENCSFSLHIDKKIGANQLTFNAASDRLYVVNGDAEIACVSIPDCLRLESLGLDEAHRNAASISLIAAAPKADLLASISNDGKILLWDLDSGNVIQEFAVDLASATHLDWDPNGQHLTVSGTGRNGSHCFFIETQDGKVIPVPGTFDGNTADISPDGERAVLHDRGGPAFHFVDLKSGEVRRQLVDASFNSHRSLFIQDDEKVRCGNRIFDPITGVLREEDKDRPGAIGALGPNEQWKAYSVGESEIHFVPRAFDQDTVVIKPYRLSQRWQWRVRPQSGVLAMPDENFVRLWDPTTGKELAKLPHPAQVWSIEWSPSGKEIASISDDQVLRIWDVEQRAVIEEYSKWPMPVSTYGYGIQLAWVDSYGTSLLVPYSNTFLKQRRGESKPDTLPNLKGFVPRNVLDRILMSPNRQRTFVRDIYEAAQLISDVNFAENVSFQAGWQAAWHTDSRRILIEHFGVLKAYDTVSGQWLGTLWPELSDGGWMVIGPTGHCRGSKGIAEHVVYVAQLDDGSNITLSPQEFAERFGWKNDPEKATLMGFSE